MKLKMVKLNRPYNHHTFQQYLEKHYCYKDVIQMLSNFISMLLMLN